MSVREALLSPSEVLPVGKCVGRVLAAATVGCPPAVPIVVSGERIDQSAVACFAYYGIETCAVVKEDVT
jgi:arginine/lysine/ornithine decarboxylase